MNRIYIIFPTVITIIQRKYKEIELIYHTKKILFYPRTQTKYTK
jgi:hypothetical protein